jgi:hypothetical protein
MSVAVMRQPGYLGEGTWQAAKKIGTALENQNVIDIVVGD